MPNNDSTAFELALKKMHMNDIKRAYSAYEYFLSCVSKFNDSNLNNYLNNLADLQIEVYKLLCDAYYNRYGVYPQND